MSDDACQLPNVFTGQLTSAQFDELVEQWRTTRLLAVLIRQPGAQRANPDTHTLDQAVHCFRQQHVGIQVRYLHEGREWWDTLKPTSGGAQLVRIQHLNGENVNE